jgi:hypothetical protein
MLKPQPRQSHIFVLSMPFLDPFGEYVLRIVSWWNYFANFYISMDFLKKNSMTKLILHLATSICFMHYYVSNKNIFSTEIILPEKIHKARID